MLSGPPTKAQLTATFQRIVAAIDDESMSCAPVCVGLDEATAAALNSLAADRRHSAAKIMAARVAFAAQLAAMTTPADDTAYLAELLATESKWFGPQSRRHPLRRWCFIQPRPVCASWGRSEPGRRISTSASRSRNRHWSGTRRSGARFRPH